MQFNFIYWNNCSRQVVLVVQFAVQELLVISFIIFTNKNYFILFPWDFNCVKK